jgi:DNA-binding transcriptional ArsR family regulator
MAKKEPDFEGVADILDLMGNPVRLKLLSLLDGKTDVGALATAVGLSFSGVSQHLARLKAYGVVTAVRNAEHRQQMFYERNQPKLLAALDEARKLMDGEG